MPKVPTIRKVRSENEPPADSQRSPLSRPRKVRVVVGKFAPGVNETEPYYVGIDVHEGKPGTNAAYSRFDRLATFYRRGHAERFAWLLRQDGL